MPPPPVLQIAGSSSVAPPLALTAREEVVGLPADDADAVALGRDITEQHVTSVMEMGIREHRDRITRLAVALLVLGIEEYVIVARYAPQQGNGTKKHACELARRNWGHVF